MANAASMVTAAAQGAASAGNTALIVLVAGGVALYLAVILARRMLQAPSPEKAARKLMKQFAQRDGVAAYVLAGDETPEDEAASIEVLANDEHKTFRQRRLTASHRTLASSLQRLLNRPADDTQPLVH
jgi:tRNA A37 N6-isopentenylltransferase MiaA